MMTVPLYGKKAAGRVALVDDEDYDLVKGYRWYLWERQAPGRRTEGPYARARVFRNGGQGYISMHKLITGWTRTDHADRNGLNNQRSNLRPATTAQNTQNQRPQLGTSSRFKGVTWSRGAGKWQAQIQAPNTPRYLGLFTSEEDAARAYNAAALKAFGSYAYLNEVA